MHAPRLDIPLLILGFLSHGWSFSLIFPEEIFEKNLSYLPASKKKKLDPAPKALRLLSGTAEALWSQNDSSVKGAGLPKDGEKKSDMAQEFRSDI